MKWTQPSGRGMVYADGLALVRFLGCMQTLLLVVASKMIYVLLTFTSTEAEICICITIVDIEDGTMYILFEYVQVFFHST